MNRRYLTYGWLLLLAMGARPAAGQNWDTSGNGLLNGVFYFRQVIWYANNNASDTSGSLSRAVAIYGNIRFDGQGGYILSGAQICDSNVCSNGSPTRAYTVTGGTYAISASGYGFLENFYQSGDNVYGLVSPQGVFIGSSPDNATGYNDLFIAAKVPAPAPTNSFFNGNYAMADIDFPGVGSQLTLPVRLTRASSFQLKPNGTGTIDNFTASGSIAGGGSTTTTQPFSNVSYLFRDSAAVVNFGGSLTATAGLLAGTKYFYFSPDGNFLFGGSPTGWDMIVGVRTGGSPSVFGGLYYQAGVDQDDSTLSQGGAATNSRFGSVIAIGGTLLGHRRVLSVFNNNAYDYTHTDSYTVNPDGTYDDPYDHYVFSSGGAYAVGIGSGAVPGTQGFLLGINVLLQAPVFTGPGSPYINPVGVLNSGSSAPFTAGWAPGELVSIYGSNLTSATLLDPSLPITLGGVQVLVNGNPAPIYAVAHTRDYDQINAVIPLTTPAGTASLQVNNNGALSNPVINFLNRTQPGIFNSYSITPAVLHAADSTLVTSNSPAHVGETLSVYLTGLGTNDTANTTNIAAFIDGIKATVSFAGTQSQVGGAYQVNVTVPNGVSTGTNVYLDVSGPDAYNSSVLIPIGSGGAASVSPTSMSLHRLPANKKFPKLRQNPQGPFTGSPD